jgi:hypothetical protein
VAGNIRQAQPPTATSAAAIPGSAVTAAAIIAIFRRFFSGIPASAASDTASGCLPDAASSRGGAPGPGPASSPGGGAPAPAPAPAPALAPGLWCPLYPPAVSGREFFSSDGRPSAPPPPPPTPPPRRPRPTSVLASVATSLRLPKIPAPPAPPPPPARRKSWQQGLTLVPSSAQLKAVSDTKCTLHTP